jgi:bleomycin hydrolase
MKQHLPTFSSTHILTFTVFLFCLGNIEAQPDRDGSAYHFTNEVLLNASSVKNQALTNTCFVFAVVSLLESELIQQGRAAPDLSEMYLVRSIYIEKAKKFLRLHGNMFFTGGGELNDVLDILPLYGLLPRDLYSGLPKGSHYYDHQQLEDSLRTYLTNLVSSSVNKVAENWMNDYSAILDKYLGKLSDSLNVLKGSTYPINYFKTISFNKDDYILLTSFTHHKYYSAFSLEVPDNWSWGEAVNIPLEEFKQTCYYALKNGFSVAWAADDTEEGFSWKNGLAMVPDESNPGAIISSQKNWTGMTAAQKHNSIYSFSFPIKEQSINSLLRQKAFDDYSTTDDHCMHIVGLAHDENNYPYFIVKNSWGSTNTKYNGYLYVSESYFLLKSIAILLNRKAVPPEIIKKLQQS